MSVAVVIHGVNERMVQLITPYDAGFVGALKRTVPPDLRRWDGDTKRWIINEVYADAVYGLLAECFDGVEHVYTAVRAGYTAHKGWLYATTSTGSNDHGQDAYRILHLSPSAPLAVIEAAYRALAKECHPDVGGSDARMKQLNVAYDRLRSTAKR